MIGSYVSFDPNETVAQQHEKILDQLTGEILYQQDTVGNLAALPIVDFGGLPVNLSADPHFPPKATFTVPHNLGYAPIFLVYFYSPGINQYVLLPTLDQGAGLPSNPLRIGTALQAYSDANNLYIQWYGQAQTPFQQFYYFIFNNPVSQ